MRLIDADKTLDEINEIGGHNLCEWETIGVKALIDRQPTVDIKTEVPREMFAEIEKVATINLHTGEIKITYPDYIKLKNKYTKEGVGE